MLDYITIHTSLSSSSSHPHHPQQSSKRERVEGSPPSTPPRYLTLSTFYSTPRHHPPLRPPHSSPSPWPASRPAGPEPSTPPRAGCRPGTDSSPYQRCRRTEEASRSSLWWWPTWSWPVGTGSKWGREIVGDVSVESREWVSDARGAGVIATVRLSKCHSHRIT